MDELTLVDQLLRAAGMHPPTEEVAEMAAAHAQMRALTALLWALDDARHEVPATIFRADPPPPPW